MLTGLLFAVCLIWSAHEAFCAGKGAAPSNWKTAAAVCVAVQMALGALAAWLAGPHSGQSVSMRALSALIGAGIIVLALSGVCWLIGRALRKPERE